MLHSGTDPESYITNYTLVYEEYQPVTSQGIRRTSLFLALSPIAEFCG